MTSNLKGGLCGLWVPCSSPFVKIHHYIQTSLKVWNPYLAWHAACDYCHVFFMWLWTVCSHAGKVGSIELLLQVTPTSLVLNLHWLSAGRGPFSAISFACLRWQCAQREVTVGEYWMYRSAQREVSLGGHWMYRSPSAQRLSWHRLLQLCCVCIRSFAWVIHCRSVLSQVKRPWRAECVSSHQAMKSLPCVMCTFTHKHTEVSSATCLQMSHRFWSQLRILSLLISGSLCEQFYSLVFYPDCYLKS